MNWSQEWSSRNFVADIEILVLGYCFSIMCFDFATLYWSWTRNEYLTRMFTWEKRVATNTYNDRIDYAPYNFEKVFLGNDRRDKECCMIFKCYCLDEKSILDVNRSVKDCKSDCSCRSTKCNFLNLCFMEVTLLYRLHDLIPKHSLLEFNVPNACHDWFYNKWNSCF